MRHIDDIAAKVRRAERIDDAEAARLWREAPLWLLGELATAAKQRVSGDKVYYNRNFHIEPTNRCVFNCRFCSYRRPAGDPEAWDYTMDEIEQIARERQGKGITEVHIVGGVHPDHGLDYYTDDDPPRESHIARGGRQGIYGDRTVIHDPQGGTDDGGRAAAAQAGRDGRHTGRRGGDIRRADPAADMPREGLDGRMARSTRGGTPARHPDQRHDPLRACRGTPPPHQPPAAPQGTARPHRRVQRLHPAQIPQFRQPDVRNRRSVGDRRPADAGHEPDSTWTTYPTSRLTG